MIETITLRSIDGTRLVADFYQASGGLGAVLVHGITSDRKEAGFYQKLACELQELSIKCLALDLRSHGDSDGHQDAFSLSGAINDIYCAISYLEKHKKVTRILLIAASFGGGLSIRAAEMKRNVVKNMVLYNPRLDYTTWVHDTIYWEDEALSDRGMDELRASGYITRNGFKIGINLLNELLCFDPARGLKDLDMDILFVHGDRDFAIPMKSSVDNYNLNGRGELIIVQDAAHGFTDYRTDDPFSDISKRIRNNVIADTVKWTKAKYLKG